MSRLASRKNLILQIDSVLTSRFMRIVLTLFERAEEEVVFLIFYQQVSWYIFDLMFKRCSLHETIERIKITFKQMISKNSVELFEY